MAAFARPSASSNATKELAVLVTQETAEHVAHDEWNHFEVYRKTIVLMSQGIAQ